MVIRLKRQPTEWGKIFTGIHLWKINNQNKQGAQKTKVPQKSMNWWRNGQMKWTKFFQRSKFKWLKIWRNAQHPWPWRKCKSKPC
jgi:hypothetical protein